MKISVIIPAYNHEKYVTEAIESVLNQSCQDFEVIVVNDGSTDSTEQKIVAIQDHRIRCVSQENSGAHAAINRGIALARGEYVSILNSDDVYLPKRLETCLAFLENNRDYSVAMTTVEGICGDGTPVRQSVTPQIQAWLDWYAGALPFFCDDRFYPNAFAKNIMITTSNLFVRRACFQECNGFRALRYAHDWDMLLRLSKRYRIHLIKEDLLKYRMHPENTVHERESDLKVQFEVNWLVVENLKELNRGDLTSEIVELFNDNNYLYFEALFFLLLLKEQPAFDDLINFNHPITIKALQLLRTGINRAAFLELQGQVQDLKTCNAWLTSEREAWEKIAAEHEGRIANLNQAVTQRDARIDGLNRAVAERDGKIAERDGRIGNLNSAVSERDRRIASLVSELHLVYTSTSWKITKPLRFLRRNLVNKPYHYLRRVLSSSPRRTELLPSPLSKQRNESFEDQPPFGSNDHQTGHDPDKKYEAHTLYEENKRHLENSHKILLVIHEFSRSGAPQAVLYLAQAILESHQIRPVIISPVDGPIREEFEKGGFPTIVEPLLLTNGIEAPAVSKFISGFELVIATSISSYYIIRHYKHVMNRLIWWIHEDAPGFANIRDNFAPDLASLFAACESVWIGSPVCSLPARQYVTADKINLLLYGCEDAAMPHRPHQSGRIVFTIVGSIEPRKGQDIFLTAVERLPEHLRCKGLFRIIGSSYNAWSDIFYQTVLARARLIPEVECLPNMPFDQLLELYSETDVVVSASRSDPMPIVITLGLMMATPCLCSSSIGHIELLDDGINALIFNNESVQELVEKMTWILQNPDALPVLGASGRKVYESHFLMANFVNNVGKLIRGLEKA
ncbi:MAG: glycosyltransferase [Syntrophales bacterium]